MASAKKRTSSSAVPTWLHRLFAWLWGSGRPALIVLAIVGLLGAGTYMAWQKIKPRVLGLPEYRVGPEQVEITPPQPDWIHTDIRQEVFRDPTLGGPLSLLDDDLTKRISKAFSRRPWVARVIRVSKRHPASAKAESVRVELVYREPVCMVEVANGSYAVDAEGVVLPSQDFTSTEATHYPRLVGVDRRPSSPAGRLWGDAKVIGGAEIAAALAPVWDAMKLDYIAGSVENASNTPGRQAMEPVFSVYTQAKTRIIWGYAPGANVPGEASADKKVARLKHYFAEHDTLDGPNGQPQELDIR